MQQMAAADELAMIRGQISRLRHREKALRDALIAAPEDQRDGRWSRVELVETVVRVFDHRLLPDTVRTDPLFWRERVMTQLNCVPIQDGATSRPPSHWRPTPRRAARDGQAADGQAADGQARAVSL